MKFHGFHSIIALISSAPWTVAEETTGRHKRKHLRDRGLQGGVDPNLNKFVVGPTEIGGKNLFDDLDVVNPEIVDGDEVDPRRKYDDLDVVNPEIVDGDEVFPRRKYKFFVSIGGCGASLVAPNVILSAAHCASIQGPAVLGLHMKTVDGADEFQNIEIIDFADSVVHPNYSGSTLNNDYWVIQLAHDSQLYQDNVAELDSPDDGFQLTAGRDVTVIGMGTTSSGGGVPNVLQEVTVDYITNQACCTDYQYGCNQITENMMCATRPGQDSCQGDSGGPIFDALTQRQVGIVSWGYGCADSRYPGVYSRISSQYNWIKAQIDNYSSGGTSPPVPQVPGECYDSPRYWYDSRGPNRNCDSVSCSDSYINGGITSNMACCDCGGGEIYNGPTPPPVPTPPTPPPSPTPPPTCSGDEIKVNIVTENYPGETTWTLTDCEGSTAASGGPYNAQGTAYSTSKCLPSSEYTFKIEDAWGDGICCSYGQGSYKVTSNGVIEVEGGEFGLSEVTTFGTCSDSPPQVVAEFDNALQVPKCYTSGSSCTSGALLDGKGIGIEPNSPNTLDDCADGPRGSYHVDESIDSITVSAVGGGELRANGLAKIEAVVWAWSDGAYDTADFYYAATAGRFPTWTWIASRPAGGEGLRTLDVEYTLPAGATQAVRVNFRYGGSQSSCTGGSWDDVDDLVFSVAPEAAGIAEVRKPMSVPAVKALPSGHCTLIGDRSRCEAAGICKWQNGKDQGCRDIGAGGLKGGSKGGSKRGSK
eukprot:CAMPEP_0172576890 /NCGR_PEP_ID=MMETSP1067-20121228/137953_1 /TAXON_ID=265564 ORGANISM="Thalassiosira punctigera, Strain Tpunct2005C2" /NCGR_SAMPLE_ID=MMETSP1067 /ASSEMBLY_ACC=CAM_ASM_000444 /LENGTH=755 /DNA_ID=CAMNT_0013369569 /DNA_START=150 /DNA_END=2417 /DNA_ORIENTATION=-